MFPLFCCSRLKPSFLEEAGSIMRTTAVTQTLNLEPGVTQLVLIFAGISVTYQNVVRRFYTLILQNAGGHCCQGNLLNSSILMMQNYFSALCIVITKLEHYSTFIVCGDVHKRMYLLFCLVHISVDI